MPPERTGPWRLKRDCASPCRTGEFEVEGPEAFIAKYEETARQLLTRLYSSESSDFTPPPPADGADEGGAGQSKNSATGGNGSWPEFGEAIHRLPKGSTGTDQILLAGQYAAMGHSDQTFATGEASQLLVGQGIKLSNPSQSMKNNLTAKRVFKAGKGYKISRDGSERINQLLGR